ncbi:hypothetical protein GGI11_001335 [Coemansia sp. RSA 2049]|nr:hypothetical protein GGI11_001335 [Coemansia sp. RSA 2049]
MKAENESLYGSSIYRGSQSVDDADLPEYMQLCRRLFPELMSEESEHAGPEAEESLARYLKYITGLPLPLLKIEPTLLQNDLQRISNDLTLLLINETKRPQRNNTNASRSEEREAQRRSSTHQLAREMDELELDQESDDGKTSDDGDKTHGLYRAGSPDSNGNSNGESDGCDLHIFNVVYETGKAASLATENINASLNEAQEALSRLETVCESFTAEMAQFDRRTKVVQRVLDKQDIITRIVELPRVMRMCVAGGYYEEAVEIAEHVRVTGDRLVRDIRDGVGSLPGSLGASDGISAVAAASREQLVAFVGSIQRQVHAEFEHMVVDLCQELGYTRLAVSGPLQSSKGQSGGAGLEGVDADGGAENADGGHERAIKRLSLVAKIVAILRSIGMFSESELRLLYLRSRWQAWQQTAETLSGFAPAVVFATMEDMNTSNPDMPGGPSSGSATYLMSFSPDAYRLTRAAEKNASSPEVSAYLEKLINAYLSWLGEADMQYRTLFVRSQSSSDETAASGHADGLATDPLTDLAIFSSRCFLSSTLPLFDLLSDASGISGLQLRVASHARKLSQTKIDFVTAFLEQRLGERAFACIVSGVEKAVSEFCVKLAEMKERALGVSSNETKNKAPASTAAEDQALEQLAVPTRPSLALPPGGFDGDLARMPSRFLGQYRVSPVGLLQYPLLARLLHSFRDSLHTLRILVLAGDTVRASKDDSGAGADVLTLLTMASIVLESELVRVADALGSLCASILDEAAERTVGDEIKSAARHACVGFVFGLARGVAEIFEEVASLSETAAAAGLCSDGDDSAMTLYAQAIYVPLLPYLLPS